MKQRMQEILDVYTEYQASHGGAPPTMREIAAIVGRSTNGVQLYKKRLIELGILQEKDRKVYVKGGTWSPPDTQLEGTGTKS